MFTRVGKKLKGYRMRAQATEAKARRWGGRAAICGAVIFIFLLFLLFVLLTRDDS